MLSYFSFVLFRRRNQLTANECRLEMFAILLECGEFRQADRNAANCETVKCEHTNGISVEITILSLESFHSNGLILRISIALNQLE